MSTLYLEYSRKKDNDGDIVDFLPKNAFNSFNSSILGLGAISREAEYQQALAAIFDLEGFTTFCNQIDSHLVVPEFLNRFLVWLFEQVSNEFRINETEEEVALWAQLPFFAKFMGDGVLFLWDTKGMASEDIGNVVVSLLNIRAKYQAKFLEDVRTDFARIPGRLRCGIARGQVLSVGDKADFVGSCINVAARLQKLASLTFACARRGFDPRVCFSKGNEKMFLTKRVAIRGVGDDELVLLLRSEFETLPPDEAKLFRD